MSTIFLRKDRQNAQCWSNWLILHQFYTNLFVFYQNKFALVGAKGIIMIAVKIYMTAVKDHMTPVKFNTQKNNSLGLGFQSRRFKVINLN